MPHKRFKRSLRIKAYVFEFRGSLCLLFAVLKGDSLNEEAYLVFGAVNLGMKGIQNDHFAFIYVEYAASFQVIYFV